MRTLLLLSLVSTAALAQSGALTISCGDCGAFQAIQVLLDGQDMGTNQPVRLINVSPGEHEVKVIKWKSPFATEVLSTGMVNFLPGTELRAKATKGKLEIYGKGAWTPPPPPVTGPTREQLDDARALLDDAKEDLDELQEKVEDADDECTGKLLGRLGSLEDALGDALRAPGRAAVDAALQRALDAQKVISARCEQRSAKKWGRTVDRVVGKLQAAARGL